VKTTILLSDSRKTECGAKQFLARLVVRAAPFALLCLLATLAFSQPSAGDAKQRSRAVRDLAKQGADGIAGLAPYVTDPSLEVRVEAVKALVEISGPKTLDPLVTATRDTDPEIQIRSTDGLVNVYLPGYVKVGLSGSLQRVGNSVKGKFTDTDDQVIDSYLEVRPDVIAALGKLATGGAGMDARANAARALGILRGRAAIPDLVQALHSKDDRLMYESLIAVQKIRDPSAAPDIAFLLRDLEEKIQIAALETTGILRNRAAAPDVRDALTHTRNIKVRRTALEALAMIADPSDHALFLRSLADKDDASRASAAEGLGRVKNTGDRTAVEKAFADEHKMNARLSMAFAMVALGNLDSGPYSALRYLVNTLNVNAYKGLAVAFLTELARESNVRQALYPFLTAATKDEKIQMSIVLSRSGDRDSLPYLETLSTDPVPDVAAEGIRSLKSLRARLP